MIYRKECCDSNKSNLVTHPSKMLTRAIRHEPNQPKEKVILPANEGKTNEQEDEKWTGKPGSSDANLGYRDDLCKTPYTYSKGYNPTSQIQNPKKTDIHQTIPNSQERDGVRTATLWSKEYHLQLKKTLLSIPRNPDDSEQKFL